MENLNLSDVGIVFPVLVDELNEDAKDWIGQSEGYADIHIFDVDHLVALDPDAYVDTSCAEYDEETARDFLNKIVKPAEHYLVFGFNCTWDGRNGYLLTNDIIKAFQCQYDAVMHRKASSKGKKAVLLWQAHHDVPMGHDEVVVALTEKEFNNLSNATFKEIQTFAEEQKSKCK